MWPNTVTKQDLRIEYYRGSGAGGQKRNKTSNACRITHILTGKSSSCEEGRSQTQNRKEAFRKLTDILVPIMEAEIRKNDFKINVNQKEVRVYRAVDRIVKDQRLQERFDYYDVLEHNGLDEIIDKLAALA